MKPAWDQLGSAYADSSSVVIGDVDCTIEKALCGRFGVRGYPTIKYFTGDTAADGDKYSGGRDYAALKAFVDENLGPSCGAEHKDLCDAEQTAILDAGLALSAADLEAAIKEKTDAITHAERTFGGEMRKIKAEERKLTAAKDAAVAAVKPSLGLYKSIKAAAPAAAGHDEL